MAFFSFYEPGLTKLLENHLFVWDFFLNICSTKSVLFLSSSSFCKVWRRKECTRAQTSQPTNQPPSHHPAASAFHSKSVYWSNTQKRTENKVALIVTFLEEERERLKMCSLAHPNHQCLQNAFPNFLVSIRGFFGHGFFAWKPQEHIE